MLMNIPKMFQITTFSSSPCGLINHGTKQNSPVQLTEARISSAIHNELNLDSQHNANAMAIPGPAGHGRKHDIPHDTQIDRS